MKYSDWHFAIGTPVRLSLASLAVSAVSFTAIAQEQLSPLTVTTNRMPSENLLAPTTVITRADIERLQIADLPSLLSQQPGIDMAVSGGIGKSSSIFMRGTNSDHVLVLIDGVKWRSATLGTPTIQDFPIELIDRIEIVRGPRSGLYGAEAMGGVIQIFTRKGQQGIKPFAKISYGTDNTKQIAAGVSGGNERTSYSFNANHQSTAGIDARDVVGTDTDSDGYRNNSFSTTISHKLSDKVKVGAKFIRAEATNQYDDFSSLSRRHTDSVQQVAAATVDWHVNSNWLMALQLSESRDKSSDFLDGNSNGVFNTRYRAFNIVNTVNIATDQLLNIGFDYEVDHVKGTTDYGNNSRQNRAVFTSWQGSVAKHSWLVSVRHDDNEAFDHYNSGTAEWGYRLHDDIQLTVNAGSAFKAPTFNDLFFPDVGFFVGNPDLKPEKSRSYGLGITVDEDWGSIAVNTYHTKVYDLLVYQFPINVNVSEARIKGIEFDAVTSLMGWDLAANMALLTPKDEEAGKILPRRAKRLANIHIDKQWGVWSAGGSLKLSGHRFDDSANTTRLGGYGLVDMRVAYHVNRDWSVHAKVTNLFDKKYQTVNNFNSLDRMAMITLSYQP